MEPNTSASVHEISPLFFPHFLRRQPVRLAPAVSLPMEDPALSLRDTGRTPRFSFLISKSQDTAQCSSLPLLLWRTRRCRTPRRRERLAKDGGRVSGPERGRLSEVEKLTGQDAYRLRVGDYRILYEVQEKILLVLVVKIGHRREVYRKR
jgi:mRNA-degrading endonuclease RelE of RelBE toxin-antitoxin system